MIPAYDAWDYSVACELVRESKNAGLWQDLWKIHEMMDEYDKYLDEPGVDPDEMTEKMLSIEKRFAQTLAYYVAAYQRKFVRKTDFQSILEEITHD